MAGITVEEQDGTPSVTNVTKIKVTNATLTDDGGGEVSLATGSSTPVKSVADKIFLNENFD